MFPKSNAIIDIKFANFDTVIDFHWILCYNKGMKGVECNDGF